MPELRKDIVADALNHQMLSRAIAYDFRDKALLACALTHRSSCDKDAATIYGINNERLEFLGDSVLSLVASTFLFQHNNFFSEGDLSRLRAQYVCQENIATAARHIDLARFIRSDRSMRASGSNNSKAVLCDAMEAIIGAVYLDGGFEAAQAVIFHVLGTPPVHVVAIEKDAKTVLQEIVQAQLHCAPKYIVLATNGPAHAPSYVVGVSINNAIFATASGESKKIAAHNAAVIALAKVHAEGLAP